MKPADSIGPVVIEHLSVESDGEMRRACSDLPWTPAPTGYPSFPRVLCAGCGLINLSVRTPSVPSSRLPQETQ